MDWKEYKVTSQNVSTYNPMGYTEEQMNYSKISDQGQTDLDRQAQTLEEEMKGIKLDEIEGELNMPIPFEQRVQKTRTLSRVRASALSKTWKVFGNSKEMNAIIKNVSGLNALLEGQIPRTKDGKIDADVLKQKHLKGYEAALNACQYYLDTKTPRYSWTKARYKRVQNMKETLEKERELLEVVVSNIADQKYAKEDLDNIQSPRDLLDEIRTVSVQGEAELQIEGNSTDVYRVYLNINGKEGWYYFKQNLKPVGDDLPGFVKRRLRQLNNSFSHFGDKEKEEARLNGKTDQTDYQAGIQFLNSLDTSIAASSNSVSDTRELKKRILSFLGHDFDKMFKELDEYNSRADESERTRIRLTSELAMAKTAKNNEAVVQSLTNQLKNHVVLPKMNEYEWLVKLSKDKTNPLGITMKKDRALFDVLRNLAEQQDGLAKVNGDNNRIRRLFTRTLGKEIEAYGQQKDRSKAAEDEIMAKNNTATYRIANLFGFNDVVTSSESAIVDIKLAGATQAEHISGTISVEAPGLEMLRLVEIAEKKNRKIHYSPKAIRQLVRLQMYDTTCLQTDRHWRNFKCMTKPDLREWNESMPLEQDIVIESIGSYDHDMSYGTVSLKDAFKDKNNPEGVSIKNGMLPPIMRRIKTASAESAYYRKMVMGEVDLSVFDKMQMPWPQKGSGYADSHADNSKRGLYGFRTIQISELGVDYKTLPKKIFKEEDEESRTCYEYKGLYLRPFDSKSLLVCDENGHDAGLNILEKLGYVERRLGLDYMGENIDSTRAMLRGSKMRIGGTEVSTEIVESIIDNCEVIYNLLATKEENDLTCAKRLSDLSKEDKIRVLANAMQLYNRLGQIDVSKNAYETVNVSHGTGFIEFRLRAVVFYLKQELDCMPPEEKEDLLASVKLKVLADSMTKKVKKDEDGDGKKEENANSEYVEVPSMLHMDEEAYLSICQMRERFDTDIRYSLQDLGWPEEKIGAFKKRISDQIEEIERCKGIAEKILEKKHPDPDDPLRRFLLKADDYDKITEISEIAWDPGMSYFATEDENFLMSDKDFSDFLTEDEKKSRLDNTNKHRKVERLHGLKQNLERYNTMIDGTVAS